MGTLARDTTPAAMASTLTQTLFGFDCGLDWRPTTFVKAIPSTRMCSVCGLVPAKAATLPCRHLLCMHCYGNKRKCCPLDGEFFQEEDVAISVFGKDSVLGRMVRCWNAHNGCDVEDLASAMIEHFANDCRFHVVRCASCYGKFLHTDLADHVQSCRVASLCREQPAGDNVVNAILEVKDALKKISEENASMKAQLESISERLASDRDTANPLELPTLATKLKLLEQHLNSSKGSDSKVQSETVGDVTAGAPLTTTTSCVVEKQEAAPEKYPSVVDQRRPASNARPASPATKNFLAASERNTCEFSEVSNGFIDSLKCEFMEALIEEQNRAPSRARSDYRMRNVLSEVSSRIGSLECDMVLKKTVSGKDFANGLKLLGVACLGVTNDAFNVSAPLEWVVDDWACREESSRVCGSLTSVGPCAYFYGYFIGFRITIYPLSAELALAPCVLRGIYDDFLTWPPNLAFMVRFVHPSDFDFDMIVGGENKWKDGARKTYHFREVLFEGPTHNVSLQELKQRNFIANDELRLEFEFYRPNTDLE
ncbi:hypothetical protein HPB50_021158 [Hyalomma asiaticum]|uniref:Uncharacterized protein n=1 Tax=Hyalomma asiaticum TaxID=266040 RepID=A0ACB7S7P6_HYAAI|nr:hypothetical protein HPB50_021158 [Hyalomma asiaticum]